MKDLKELFEQIHGRSLWQVLGVYLAAGWAVLEVVSTLVEQGLLTGWVFRLALVLLLIGLPIVLCTAYVQKGLHTRPRSERTGLGRVFTWRNAVLGGVGAFALWGVFAAAWLVSGGRPALPQGTPDLTGIAVLPFRLDMADEDLDGWGEGIPSLLATNLDGIGGLRKIDPRSLHTRWRREVGDDDPGVGAILDVARRAGAAYAVAGSMVGDADRVVLSAEVFGVETGEPSGPTVRVDGSADSLLSLIDELSVEILRAELIPADAELPRFDLTRATTRSLDALKAFVEGEREYRRSMYRPAIEHFNEAIQIDSAFPLALYRLATSHALEGRDDIAKDYAQRALGYSDRLPTRERLLIEAYHLFATSDDRAIDALREFTRRYPDDTEGWFLLGEAYYHIGRARLQPLRRYEEAMRKAIERNPYYGPPYIHLIDEAFHQRDSTQAIALVDQYAEIDRGTDWCVGYQVAAGLAWGDETTRQRTLAVLDTVSGDPLVCAQRSLVMTPETWEAYGVAWEEQLTRDSFDPPLRGDARLYRAWGIGQRGRIGDAVDWISEVYDGEPPLIRIRYDVWWLLAGYQEPRLRAWTERLDRGSETTPHDRFLLATLAAEEGRWDDADAQVAALRTLADRVRSAPDSAATGGRSAEELVALSDATTASIDLRRAPDDSDAVDRAVTALFATSTREAQILEILRYDIGRALVGQGRYDEARPYFESFTWLARPYKTPREYWLGRIHEGLGNFPVARVHYANFVTWWEDAEPQLRSWREEARERLTRLLEAGSTS